MINQVVNGGFSRGLYLWEGSGAIERSLGYPRLNCAHLEAGETLSQAVGISPEQYFTLHYFYRLTTGATLTIGYGDVTQEHTGEPLNVWREGVLAFSVEEGAGNGAVTLSAAGGVAYVDSVALVGGGLAATRQFIAQEVARRIPTLAAEKGLTYAPSAEGPEGSYTAGVDEALRANGALSAWGDIDVTLLGPLYINDVIEGALQATLQLLRGMFALDVDVTLGPRSESLSQRAKALDGLIGGGEAADNRASMGRLGRANGWQR